MDIQKQGCVIVSEKEFIFWLSCFSCGKLIHGTASIKVLYSDPICKHCGSMTMGAPVPPVEGRIPELSKPIETPRPL